MELENVAILTGLSPLPPLFPISFNVTNDMTVCQSLLPWKIIENNQKNKEKKIQIWLDLVDLVKCLSCCDIWLTLNVDKAFLRNGDLRLLFFFFRQF